MSLLVLKIGGSVRDPEPLLQDVAETIAHGDRVVLVHGASRDLNELSTRLGHPPRMVESGRGDVTRFTDSTTMDHFLMAYAGLANKRIVERLRQLGVNAVGLSGLDGGIVQGRRRADLRVVEDGRPRVLHDNFVGSIESVDTSLLRTLLDGGYVPVLTPPIAAEDGTAINVDGDRLAAEIAIALGANELFIFADTPGILRDPKDDTSVVASLTADDIDGLGLSGRVRPKLQATLRAAAMGVGNVRIADGRGEPPLHAARVGRGTLVRPAAKTLAGVQSLSADTPVSLGTISDDVLVVSGITLTDAPQAIYPVTEYDAVAAASSAFPGGTVVGVRLVHIVMPHRWPPLDSVCWAVSSTGNTPPSSGPYGYPARPGANHLVVFVNATTGSADFVIAN